MKIKSWLVVLRLSDGGFLFVISFFAKVPWDVFVFDHVQNLCFHSDHEEEDPVKKKNWPEDGEIENFEESTKISSQYGSNTPKPKHKFWQFPRKWSELVRIARRQRHVTRNSVQLLLLLFGINRRRQETDK